nr:RING-H2 finger protein ATL16-like [Ipomoea batatas]
MGDLTQQPQLISPATPPPPPPTPFSGLPRHSQATSFPITAVAIIGIIATGFLLLTYYIFVIKCCLNWHRIDLLRRFSINSRRRRVDDPLSSVYSLAGEIRRGLDESTIRSIPVLQYKKGEEDGGSENRECCVCLNEFQEGEKVKVLPNCGHPFHIDCIDIWLQNNPNCPLCRTPISAPSPKLLNHHQDPVFSERFTGRDEDYVVIEICQDNGAELSPTLSISPSPIPKFQEKALKLHGQSLGDECIDMCREKDERFAVEPIRRSLSMSSAVDRRQLASQDAVQRQRPNRPGVSEGSSGRPKKLCFSFGHRRGSRSSVIPVHLEL